MIDPKGQDAKCNTFELWPPAISEDNWQSKCRKNHCFILRLWWS